MVRRRFGSSCIHQSVPVFGGINYQLKAQLLDTIICKPYQDLAGDHVDKATNIFADLGVNVASNGRPSWVRVRAVHCGVIRGGSRNSGRGSRNSFLMSLVVDTLKKAELPPRFRLPLTTTPSLPHPPPPPTPIKELPLSCFSILQA